MRMLKQFSYVLVAIGLLAGNNDVYAEGIVIDDTENNDTEYSNTEYSNTESSKQSEHIDARPALQSRGLQEGRNLISTSQSGAQLYAVVENGQVVSYIVTDPEGNEVQTQTKQTRFGWVVCADVYYVPHLGVYVELCWDVFPIPFPIPGIGIHT